MVEIKIVKSKKDIKDFLKFVDVLYKDCYAYIPSYKNCEKNLFSHKKNSYLNSNETTGFLAYQEGKIVGRIMGILNRIEMASSKVVRFSHFDFINDSEVSYALLDAVCNWAKSLDAEFVIGDLGFNDLMQVGIEINNNSNKLATFQQRYNFSYYLEHLKNYGFDIQKKLNEYYLQLKEDFDEDNARILIDKNLSEKSLRFVDGTKKFKLAMYGRKIFDLLYENLNFSCSTVIDDKSILDYFKTIDNLFESQDLKILINEYDDVAGCMLLTKNTSLALQTTCGKVLASKRMYNIGGEFKNEYDISLLAINKNYMSSVCEIFANELGIEAKNNKFYAIFSNLWINSDIKKEKFGAIFDIHNIRTRAVLQKSLAKKSELIVKRAKSDLIGPIKKAYIKKLK